MKSVLTANSIWNTLTMPKHKSLVKEMWLLCSNLSSNSASCSFSHPFSLSLYPSLVTVGTTEQMPGPTWDVFNSISSGLLCTHTHTHTHICLILYSSEDTHAFSSIPWAKCPHNDGINLKFPHTMTRWHVYTHHRRWDRSCCVFLCEHMYVCGCEDRFNLVLSLWGHFCLDRHTVKGLRLGFQVSCQFKKCNKLKLKQSKTAVNASLHEVDDVSDKCWLIVILEDVCGAVVYFSNLSPQCLFALVFIYIKHGAEI